MFTNLNRSVAALSCVLLLALAGCSDSGAEGSTNTPGDATASAAPTGDQRSAAQAQTENQTTPASSRATLKDTLAAQSRTVSDELTQRTLEVRDKLQATKPAQPTQPTVTGDSPEIIVKAEPISLDLGTVGTGEQATGIVRLINTGDKPMRIINCKANCGCTTTNCPRNKELQPGESVEVEVQMKAGARGGVRQSKSVSFIVEGQPILKVPVSVDVVAYVEIEPKTIDPTQTDAGRVVIRALDDQPFRVLAMNPPMIEAFDDEARLEHVLYLPADQLQAQSRSRKIDFTLDHPNASKVSLTVRRPRVASRSTDLRRNAQRAPTAVENALVMAARTGDVAAIVQAVIDGKNLEQLDNDGATLLGVAARAKQVEVVGVLLEAGANPEALDRKGRSPLMAAVQTRESSTEVVKALIAKGANVNTRDGMIGGSPLSWAAGPFGNPEIVDALVAAKADVNTLDNLGMSPLMWAVRFGGPTAVKTLVDAGADVSAKNAQGRTSLDLAREKGNDAQSIETIKILEAKSATSEAATGESDS